MIRICTDKKTDFVYICVHPCLSVAETSFSASPRLRVSAVNIPCVIIQLLLSRCVRHSDGQHVVNGIPARILPHAVNSGNGLDSPLNIVLMNDEFPHGLAFHFSAPDELCFAGCACARVTGKPAADTALEGRE